MRFHLKTLTLQLGKSLEPIDLTAHVSFFHGKMSTGKSSVAKFIDACLGGVFPETTAIKQEFVSALLAVQIGSYDVLFERAAKSNQVQVTWLDANGAGATVLAPIENADAPIWSDSVYGLSDLIFFLAGIGPMRVRRNKLDPDAPLIPLSFRDIMWYCYLDQDELDSTFFHLLQDDPRLPKSRDVMRFVLGYYTELLNELEQKLSFEVDSHRSKLEAAEQMRSFFADLGYDSELEIASEISTIEQERSVVALELTRLREQHTAETHFSDDLRSQLRELSAQLSNAEQLSTDLGIKLFEEQALRAEVLATKFKLSRLESASTILSDVSFESCPKCGTPTRLLEHSSTSCSLCGASSILQAEILQAEPQAFKVTSTQRDLDAQLVDIEASISRREKARKEHALRLGELRAKKVLLDAELSRELATYDSAFLSQVRSQERNIATLDQRLIGLRRDAKIPQALRRFEEEADRHQVEAARLRRLILEERKKLGNKEHLIESLESYFYEALAAVGFPGFSERDIIRINRRNWLPFIIPNRDESLAYSYTGTGSGGKKTLFNVCFALAFHRLSEEYSLPLPTLLMIDSPMKNIGTEINKNVFLAVHRYVYSLAAGPLAETQLVIFDSEMAPPPKGLDFKERLMLDDDPQHPPLIPYYHGH